MRLNLLYVLSTLSWGGLEMNVLRLAKELCNRGHSVTIACNPKGRLYREINMSESNHFKVIVLGDSFFENLKIFFKLLNRTSFDILHVFRSSDVKFVSFATYLSRSDIKVIFEPQIGVGVRKKDLFHKFVYERVKIVVAPSGDVASGFLKNLPIQSDKLRVIHLGVDVDKFKYREDIRRKIRREFGFCDDEIVIGVVSRFSPGKGHEELFKAFKILMNEFEKVKLLIVGEPTVGELKYFESLRKLQDELGISNKTVWTGFRRDVNDILCGMDIFVAPSHAEAFGLSLVEAMATQLPVVASKSAGFLDIISEGENGLFFEKGNYYELAEKIRFLIKNNSLAVHLGRKAREVVCDRFSFQRYVNDIEKLYSELMDLKQTEARNVQHSKP